jgi:hypothetical protein
MAIISGRLKDIGLRSIVCNEVDGGIECKVQKSGLLLVQEPGAITWNVAAEKWVGMPASALQLESPDNCQILFMQIRTICKFPPKAVLQGKKIHGLISELSGMNSAVDLEPFAAAINAEGKCLP